MVPVVIFAGDCSEFIGLWDEVGVEAAHHSIILTGRPIVTVSALVPLATLSVHVLLRIVLDDRLTSFNWIEIRSAL